MVSTPRKNKGKRENKTFYKENRGWSSKVKEHKANHIIACYDLEGIN